MSSETARDTALATSYAAARSVTMSPSSGSTVTKLVNSAPLVETSNEHDQDGTFGQGEETTAQTEQDDGSADVDAVLRFFMASPSPTGTETEVNSTPPAEAGHLRHQDKIDEGRTSQNDCSPRYGLALTTPQCPMTGEELGSLRKPGDSVITKEGHTVQLVEDGGGRLLFLSQIPSSTPPTSYQKPSPESSNSVRCPLQKKSGKRVSKLASIDPSNIIAMTDTEEEGSRRGTPPTSAMPPSYSLRNRRAPQGKLIYDAKYHPMDDSIRPSQAAKRRSAHGEIILSSDDETETETFTVHSDSEAEGEADNEDLIKKFRPSKNKKRSRSRSESLLPTRRSSRRITKQKILYNMDVHPQDRYLEVSSSSDDDPEVSSHDVKRKKASRLIKNTPVHEQKYQAKFINTTIADSEVEDENNINSEEPTRDNVSDGRSDEDTIQVQVRDLPLTSSSPVPNVSTTPAFGARHAEELEACLMKPGERSLLHGRDPWPIKQGLPFKIHTECLEDQLAAEADAASPFNLDDDDKENNVIDVRYGNTLDPTEGVSVIPVSQYRSSREGSESFNHLAASAAFYDTTYHGSHLAYNLGGSDGSHDQDVVIDKAKPKAAATRLRTSTDRRPSTTIVQEQQKEVDQALRDTSSGSVDGGSLMRELRTFTPINRRS